MRAAIFGYGNLGKGVEKALLKKTDVEVIGIFTRRKAELSSKESAVPFYDAGDILRYKDSVDVVFNCGGSHAELPKTTPFLASSFHVIDSFDHHAAIKEHYSNVDLAAKKGERLALISAGWDPGILSVIRILSASFLHDSVHTLWGPGVSQGHSEVLRKIEGVKNAVSYTVPNKNAEEVILRDPAAKEKKLHTRICYLELDERADPKKIEKQIRSIPDYFYGYNVEIHFVSNGEIQKNHSAFPHAGKVLAFEKTGTSFSFGLQTRSNPDFTGSVMTVYGLALWEMAKTGKTGAITPADVPIGLLLHDSRTIFDYI